MIEGEVTITSDIDYHARFRDYAVALLLFIIALLPRVTSLGTMLTSDERAWTVRSLNFINALLGFDFAGTYQAPHPGVITMWLSGIPLHLFYQDGMSYYTRLFIGQLPIALATSAGIVLIYYLLKKIFGLRIALLGTALIALDPFFIAYSRLIHLDAILTTLMAIVVLSLIAYLNDPEKRSYLYLSGIFTGLAFLEKTPSAFLVPYAILAVVLWFGIVDRQSSETCFAALRKNAPKALKIIGVVLALAAIVFVALWPAVWADPPGTLSNVFTGTEVATEYPHGSGFYLGQASVGNYGISYYPVVLAMKLTPITLVFSIVCVLFLAAALLKGRLSAVNMSILLLLLFIVFFGIQMTIGEKKFDRYILPVSPIVDILAAVGIVYTAEGILRRISSKDPGDKPKRTSKASFALILIAVVLIGGVLLLQVQPYYLAYFNPALGGSELAPELLLVGRGEGMEQAANYLNAMSDAENLSVATQYPIFSELFKGRTLGMNETNNASYVIFYIGMVQRQSDPDLWAKYRVMTPEKVVRINNMDYCWIYKVDHSPG